MKSIFKTLLISLTLIPSLVLGVTAVGWNTPTPTTGWVLPNMVNGTNQIVDMVNGFFSTASSTQSAAFYLSSLAQGVAYIGTNGLVGSTATTTGSCSGNVSCSSFTVIGSSPITINGTGSTFSGAINSVVTTDSGGGLIATGTQLTVGNILATTTADNTFRGRILLPNISQGFAYIDSSRSINSVASSTIKLSWFNNDSGFTTNTGTVTQVNTTWPIIGGPFTTTGTLTFGGLGTTTGLTTGRVPYVSGVNTFADVSTSSIASGVGITVTNGSTAYVLGSQPSIACNTASLSVFGCLATSDYSLLKTATTTFSAPLVYTLGTNAVTCPTCTIGGLTVYDAFTHPFTGASATTTTMISQQASTTQLSVTNKAYFGGTSTTTIDIAGNVLLPSGSNLTITGKSDGCATFLTGVLNSTGTACGSGGGNSFAFPFTINTGYNSTTTVIGFNGLFSTASSTFVVPPTLPSLSQGFAYIDSAKQINSVASSSINLSGFNNDLANLTAGNTSLTFSGNYNGSTARTVLLNLANANSFTGLQTFLYSSSTYASFTTASTTNLNIGGQSFVGLLGTGLSNVGGILTNSGVITLGNGTGTTCSGTNPGTCNVNTSQNITTLSNLTNNGFVITSGSNGTLGIQQFPATVAQGGTNKTSYPINSIITSDSAGTSLIATGTQLTVGNILATTTRDNIFLGDILQGTSTNPLGAQIALFSTIMPQISLSYGAGTPQIYQRNAGGNFYMGTTSVDGLSTSTVSALSFNGTTGAFGFGDDTSDFKIESIGTTGLGYLGISSSNGEGDIFKIGTLGQVGISSTTPWATLGVNGIAGQASNQLAVGSSTGTSLLVTNRGDTGVCTKSPNVGGYAGATLTISSDCNAVTTGIANLEGIRHITSAASTVFQYTGGSDSNSALGRVSVLSGLVNTSGQVALGTSFLNGAIVNHLLVDSDGKVGIGTTSALTVVPGKLTIASSTTAQLTFQPEQGAIPWSIRAVGGGFYLATSSATSQATSSIAMFAINGNGNFGIASNTPSTIAKLSIGGGWFTTASSTGMNGINITNGCYAINGVCLSTTAGGSGYNLVQDEGSPLTARTTINCVGAGIACSDSGSVTTFTVSGTSFTGAINSIVTTDSGGALIATGTQLTVGNLLATSTTANNIFLGDILQGTTTNPINAQALFTSSLMPQLSIGTGIGGTPQWTFRNAGGNFYLASTSADGLATSSIAKFTILGSNGYVGIGTTTPSAPLTVVGNILIPECTPTATSTSMTLDFSVCQQYNIQIGTSAVTLTLSNLMAGQGNVVYVSNSRTNASTITWAKTLTGPIYWPGSTTTAPTHLISANHLEMYTFRMTQGTSTTSSNPIVTGGYAQY